MDRRVKERLVGASILVVLIVLIVPELLSGPASPPAAGRPPNSTPEPVRNVTVDLATSKAPSQEPAVEAASAASDRPPGVQPQGGQPTHAQSAAAQSSAAQTPGEHAPTSPAETAVLPAAMPPAPARTTDSSRAAAQAPLESAGPPPTFNPSGAKSAASGRAWAVQLGSFASRDNADKLVRQLKGQGFTVYVSSNGSGSAMRHRVRIGPLTDRGAAAQTVVKLKSLGQAASIVAPGS